MLELIVEIPRESTKKVEYDPKTQKLVFDRELEIPMVETYGSIIGSRIQEDGDEADFFILSDNLFERGLIFSQDNLVLIGAIDFFDKGQKDTKNLFILKEEYNRIFSLRKEGDFSGIKRIMYKIKQIVNFLQTYKKVFILQKDVKTHVNKVTFTKEFKTEVNENLVFGDIHGVEFKESSQIWSEVINYDKR